MSFDVYIFKYVKSLIAPFTPYSCKTLHSCYNPHLPMYYDEVVIKIEKYAKMIIYFSHIYL